MSQYTNNKVKLKTSATTPVVSGTVPTGCSPLMPRCFRLVLVTAAVFGCVIAGPATAGTASRVVASIKPVHSLVSAVMAGVGEPHLIMRGSSSPHTFSLRPSDAAVLEDAHVVFLVGESLETSLAGPINSLAGNARVIALSEAKGLVRKPLREGGRFEDHDHGTDEDHEPHEDEEHTGEAMTARGHDDHDAGEHGALDMHIWLDPVNAGAMVRMIADALSEADPANAAIYAANTQALLHRLEELTLKIAADMAPVRNRPFIVFHDAYRHFEDRFGLTAAGSAVVASERSPGVRRILELRNKVRELGATCVFAEPQFEPRLVNTIIEGTPARVGILDPLGATIESGPEAYFTLLGNMAASFRDCLIPARQD